MPPPPIVPSAKESASEGSQPTLISYEVLSTGILILFSISEKKQLSSTGKNISALRFCHCQKYTHLFFFIKKKKPTTKKNPVTKPKQKHTKMHTCKEAHRQER